MLKGKRPLTSVSGLLLFCEFVCDFGKIGNAERVASNIFGVSQFFQDACDAFFVPKSRG